MREPRCFAIENRARVFLVAVVELAASGEIVQKKEAWFKKGSGTVAGTARRVLRTTVPDPFLNHAKKDLRVML